MPEVNSAAIGPHIFLFFHSLLRWGILITVAVAGFAALIGRLRRGPVIRWQRAVAIWAMGLCHAQLALGLILYAMDISDGVFKHMSTDREHYWKSEHLWTMLLVIALVTGGRLASKQAKTEQGKHVRVAVFYLLALGLMLWTIPWPFTAMGDGRGWI